MSGNEKIAKIETLINPRHLPEAGFQSYAELTSDALDQRDTDGVARLFAGKYDPTNSVQRDLMAVAFPA
ncbi:MAG: hypothetical protein Q4F02_00045 [Candidatus Saccharibacteria bacterium]|nr:hypothetical protein [Candidatus Saccharibacteria bacterium]